MGGLVQLIGEHIQIQMLDELSRWVIRIHQIALLKTNQSELLLLLSSSYCSYPPSTLQKTLCSLRLSYYKHNSTQNEIFFHICRSLALLLFTRLRPVHILG